MKEITGTARAQSHMTDILFALSLFCVFAACALMVVLIGARVYENTAKGMESNFDLRTSVSYVTAKIRQSDARDAVYLDNLGGVPALVLEQEMGGGTYQTWIYHYDGMLRELLVEKGAGASPDSGQGIAAVRSFQITPSGAYLLVLRAEDNSGEWVEASVGLRCETGPEEAME